MWYPRATCDRSCKRAADILLTPGGLYFSIIFLVYIPTTVSHSHFSPSPFPNVFSIPHPLLRKYYTFSFFTSYELPVLCIIWKEKQHIGMGRWVNRNWHTHHSTEQRGNKTGSLKSHVDKKNSLALIHSNLYQESPYIQKFDFIDDPLGKGEKNLTGTSLTTWETATPEGNT